MSPELAEISAKLDALAEKIDVLTQLVQGNGEPGRGLVMRVDRLERAEEARKWWIRSVAAGVIGLIAERLRGLL